MKRPAFQFYPSDWRKDLELQACSIGARGLWHEMICVMHEADPYGYMVINGKKMTDAQAARACGVTVKEYQMLLAELVEAGVPGITEDGIIYSRRMVRDEAIRNARAAGGAAGAEHGVKGAGHGTKGGRPRTSTGDKKPPLPISTEPPSPPPKKPPPSVSASASASENPEVSTPTGTAAVDNSKAGEPRGDTSPKVNGNSALEAIPKGWQGSNRGIEECARVLNIEARPGDGHDVLKRRCFDRIAELHRGTH